jgi:hypothetical protein
LRSRQRGGCGADFSIRAGGAYFLAAATATVIDLARISCRRAKSLISKTARQARLLADKLVKFALDGESWAFAQVMDRLEGKPIQETNVNVTRRLVDELTDDELAERIAAIIGRARAASTIDGSCEETTDTQEPDGVVPVLRLRAG